MSSLISKQLKSERKLVMKPNFPSIAFPKIIRSTTNGGVNLASTSKKGIEFINDILKLYEIELNVDENELKRMKISKPFIVVSNHPFGILDGLIMIKILHEINPNSKVVSNAFLNKIPEIQHLLIHLSLDAPNETNRNKSDLKKIDNHLKKGYPIGIFPSNKISTYQFGQNRVSDSKWNPIIGKIIKRSNVDVIPIYFHGFNNLFLALSGFINTNFGAKYIPTELLSQKNKNIILKIGKPIDINKLDIKNNYTDLVQYIRAKTYLLGSPLQAKQFFNLSYTFPKKAVPVITEQSSKILQNEINSLHSSCLLFKKNQYECYIASSYEIPFLLKEIGRLREITFRKIGEGTNKKYDLDSYDIYYYHLILWNREDSRIIGSYRIGLGKEIYESYGKKGLYLHSLFKMKDEIIPVLKTSIELGRAFIVDEYQQKPLPLMLLWKGIMLFLRKNPDLTYLIGPVSISNNFSGIAKKLIVGFVKAHYYDGDLANLVTARKRFRIKNGESNMVSSVIFQHKTIESLNSLMQEIEPAGIPLPVLLKKYILQGGKIIGFNLDPKFNNALDGFLILNIKKIPEQTFKMLEK